MVEVLGPSCHKRENFPPEIDVYKVPHSRFDKLGKKHCRWRFIEMFLNRWLLQDEGTCHFCGTDFATDWGELIGKVWDDNLLRMFNILYMTSTAWKLGIAEPPEKGASILKALQMLITTCIIFRLSVNAQQSKVSMWIWRRENQMLITTCITFCLSVIAQQSKVSIWIWRCENQMLITRCTSLYINKNIRSRSQ